MRYKVLILTIIVIPLSGQWRFEDVRITDTEETSIPTWTGGWSIASDSENVHIVWQDFSYTERIRYTHFPVYSPPTTSEGEIVNSVYGFSPVVAINGEKVHICWYVVGHMQAREILGDTWGSIVSWESGLYPAIADDVLGNTHCVYMTGEKGGISYKKIYWNGPGYNKASVPLPELKGNYYPSICTALKNQIHITSTSSSYPYPVYHSFSLNNGVSWTSGVTAAPDAFPYTPTSICTDSEGRIYVAYRSSFAPYNIFVAKKAGDFWSTPEMVSSGRGFNHNNPSLCCDTEDNIWVFWGEYRLSTKYCFEIFYNKWDNATGSWDGATQLTESDGFISEWPQASADKLGNINVCWADYRDGEREIYYNVNNGINEPDTTEPPELDLAMARVLRPWAIEIPGKSFKPSCRIWNNIDKVVFADIFCRIIDSAALQTVYQDTIEVPLESGYTDIEGFRLFTPGYDKVFDAFFEVVHSQDVNPDNNFKIQRFTTVRDEDITPYDVVRPKQLEKNHFSPAAIYAERAGFSISGVCLWCKIEDAINNSLVYQDFIENQTFNPYDTVQLTFSSVTQLKNETEYIITFWATGPGGVTISRPPLTHFFYYESDEPGISVEDTYCFALNPVTPNPITGEAVVSFCLGNHSDVSLEIYDVSGRSVVTLISDACSPGSHTVAWNTHSLPNGVYFIRLETSVFETTEKVIVLH